MVLPKTSILLVALNSLLVSAQISLYDFNGPSSSVFSLPFFAPFGQTIIGEVVSADTAPVTADATIALSCHDATCPGARTASYTIGTKTIAFSEDSGARWHCPISSTSVTCTVTTSGQTTTRTDNIRTLVPLAGPSGTIAEPVTITSFWNLAAGIFGLYGGTTPTPTVFATNPMPSEVATSIESVLSTSIASSLASLSASFSRASLASASNRAGMSSGSVPMTAPPSSATSSRSPMTASASMAAPASTSQSAISSRSSTTTTASSTSMAMSSSASAGGNAGERLVASGGILGAVALLIGAIVA